MAIEGVETLKQLAKEQYERRDYDGAIATCTAAAVLDPRDAAIPFRSGLARMAKAQWEAAAADFTRTLQLQQIHDARFNRGLCLLSLGQHKEAQADFEAYLAQYPDDADALRGRGTCRVRASDYRGALPDLDRAANLKPNVAATHHERAVAHSALKQWREMVADCDRVIEIDGRAVAYYNRAIAKGRLCDFYGALEDLGRYVDKVPDDADGYFVRGSRYLDVGLYDAALADLRRAAQLEPGRQKSLEPWIAAAMKLSGLASLKNEVDLAAACCERGWARYNDGDWEWSLRWFHRALEACRRHAPAWQGRGFVASVMGKLREGADDATRAIELDAKMGAAWALRGKCRRLTREFKLALADYNQAIDLRWDDPWVFYGRGLTRTELEDFKGAHEDLTRFVESLPKEAEGWFSRGWAARKLGRNRDAIADYTRSIELQPGDAQSYVNRAYARKDVGERDGAIADLRKAIELRPGDKQLEVSLKEFLATPEVPPTIPPPAPAPAPTRPAATAPAPAPAPAGAFRGPLITSARTVREHRLGAHRAVLITDVQASGKVQYAHALMVYDPAGATVLVVSSEVNAMARSMGGGSHFLGIFTGTAHVNMGDSNEWADLQRFEARALQVVAERLGLASRPPAKLTTKEASERLATLLAGVHRLEITEIQEIAGRLDMPMAEDKDRSFVATVFLMLSLFALTRACREAVPDPRAQQALVSGAIDLYLGEHRDSFIEMVEPTMAMLRAAYDSATGAAAVDAVAGVVHDRMFARAPRRPDRMAALRDLYKLVHSFGTNVARQSLG